MTAQLEITPLGAAVVEALPDRKQVSAIKRAWRKNRTCPTSVIFPTAKSVHEFYENRGKSVRVVGGDWGVKGVQSDNISSENRSQGALLVMKPQFPARGDND